MRPPIRATTTCHLPASETWRSWCITPVSGGANNLLYRAHRHNDSTAPLRIQTYTTIMLVWWVVRWTRYLYEAPRGLDPRLVERPAGWLAHVQRQYERYLALIRSEARPVDQAGEEQ